MIVTRKCYHFFYVFARSIYAHLDGERFSQEWRDLASNAYKILIGRPKKIPARLCHFLCLVAPSLSQILLRRLRISLALKFPPHSDRATAGVQIISDPESTQIQSPGHSSKKPKYRIDHNHTKMVSLLSPSNLLLAVLAAAVPDVARAVEFFMPDWVIPEAVGTPYPPMTVNAGDSLTFSWAFGTHDVWIYPSGSCDATGGIQIGTVQDNPTTYTFSEEEAGTTVTFVCDVGSHCQAGMIMDVIVLASAGGDEEDAIELETETETEEIEEEVEAEGTPVPEIFNGEDDAPVEETPAEETTETDAESGVFGVCYVCGSETAEVTQTDATVSLPPAVPGDPPFVVQCGQLYQDGLNGVIPDQSCQIISDFAAQACGCVDPDFSCNICSEDDPEVGPLEIRSGDATVVLPSDPTSARTCLELAAAGLSGELTPQQCGEATLYAFQPCQCTPVDYTCSICGEGYVVNNPNAVVDVPDIEGTYTCAELEVAGAGGVLSPQECIAAESMNRLTDPCSCIPDGGYDECLICGSADLAPMTPEVNITLSAFDTNTCGFYYEAGLAGELGPGRCLRAQQMQAPLACNCAPVDYTCNVCGGDGLNMTMLYPENNFTVPEGVANCGEVDALGVDGVITPFDCGVISPLVQTQCGCAPTNFTCNICGEESMMTITENDVAFIPGEATTCGEAQAAGFAGLIDPLRCAAITPFAQFGCGCEAGGTVSPVVEDDEDEDMPEEEIVLGEEEVDVLATVVPSGEGSTVATEVSAPANLTDALSTGTSAPVEEEESPPVVVEVEDEESAPDETPVVVATTDETVSEDTTAATTEEEEEEPEIVSLEPPPASTASALDLDGSASATASASIGTVLIGTLAAFFVVLA